MLRPIRKLSETLSKDQRNALIDKVDAIYKRRSQNDESQETPEVKMTLWQSAARPTPSGTKTQIRTVDDAVNLLNQHKANNVVKVDIPNPLFTRHFVVCDVPSEKARKAISLLFKQTVSRPVENDSMWILADCGDFVVHLMDPERRAQLRLESLWTDPADYERELTEFQKEEVIDF